MIGSLVSLVKDLNDDELASLIELAIAAVNGQPEHDLVTCAERLAMFSYAKRIHGRVE
jgi:hypothetical protein